MEEARRKVSNADDAHLLNYFSEKHARLTLPAGQVDCVTQFDLNDHGRRKHLASFQNSMSLWSTYEQNQDQIDEHTLLLFVKELARLELKDVTGFEKNLCSLRRRYRISPARSRIIQTYKTLRDQGVIVNPNSYLESRVLRKKAVRSNSGVLVITLLTSPGEFSCSKDCHYCPNEPGQPRSYLSTEPAVLRGNQNNWCPVRQFRDRAETLEKNGHSIDKIEILVLGGTWSSYPIAYQESFIRDVYYAANTYQNENDQEDIRPRRSLGEEQTINETAISRIIGLTLETRPDFINKYELARMRLYGCTRVQIGIQHIDDNILEYINRGCTLKQCIKAVRLLKDAGFKVDIHLMPDLPSSTPEKDLEMFEWLLTSDFLQADQWKIYPCEVTPFSTIEQWFKDKSYIPYTETNPEKLVNLLLKVKRAVHPWIRLNRVVRDIPNQSILAGNTRTNLRQILLDDLQARGLACRCIRCREIRDSEGYIPLLRIREFDTFGGIEYFISFETEDSSRIFGFLRLRCRNADVSILNEKIHKQSDTHWTRTTEWLYSLIKFNKKNDKIAFQPTDEEKNFNFENEIEFVKPINHKFPEINGAALIRELHVYGVMRPHTSPQDTNYEKNEPKTWQQHKGLGAALISIAEQIAHDKGLRKMAVIAGVGTREYYAKFGYELEGTYMIKHFDSIHDEQLLLSKHQLSIEKQDLMCSSALLRSELPPKKKKNTSKTTSKKRKSYSTRRPNATQELKTSRNQWFHLMNEMNSLFVCGLIATGAAVAFLLPFFKSRRN